MPLRGCFAFCALILMYAASALRATQIIPLALSKLEAKSVVIATGEVTAVMQVDADTDEVTVAAGREAPPLHDPLRPLAAAAAVRPGVRGVGVQL